MAASYYSADAENGDSCDDPSEGVVFDMIRELNDTDNTFVVIQPAGHRGPSLVRVGVAPGRGRLRSRIPGHNHREHELTVQHDVSRIAKDTTIWLASRFGAKLAQDF